MEDQTIKSEQKINVDNNQTKAYSMRKLLLLGGLISFAVSLITASFMAVLINVSRNKETSDKSLAEQRQIISQEGDVIADIAQQVGPSVVSITTQQRVTQQDLFGSQRIGLAQAAGTGLIISKEGLILTNKHVVPAGVDSVKIVMSDGTSYENVDVIGRDPLNDLAFLKVKNPKNFQAASLADSDKVRTGQKVVAIGNALGQFQNSVTSGIISGMGRPVEAGGEDGRTTEQLTNLFQTDAAINSGNSGGPLLNLNGEVIGINTAIAADAENIGFSIPINEAKGLIDGLQKNGSLARAYLGVRYVNLNPALAKQLNVSVSQGAYISTEEGSVLNGGPAEVAGVKGGDIITKINDFTINDKLSLSSAIGRFKVGDTVELTIVRGDKNIKLKAKLAEAPQQ